MNQCDYCGEWTEGVDRVWDYEAEEFYWQCGDCHDKAVDEHRAEIEQAKQLFAQMSKWKPDTPKPEQD